MAYARDSKSRSLTGLRVRLPSPAPFQNRMTWRHPILKLQRKRVEGQKRASRQAQRAIDELPVASRRCPGKTPELYH